MKQILSILVVTAMAAAAKSSRTYYDNVRIDRALQRIAEHEWAAEQKANLLAECEWYLAQSLQECWDMVPPAAQVRAINISHGVGCPDCGDAIFRKAGHYPWILERDHPFKVRCPVCSRQFPENDFQPWNPQPRSASPEEGLPITDTGVGWVDAEGHRFWFVSYYLFWQRWREDIVRGVHKLGQAYVLTGEQAYARRAAVLLARVAQQYPDFHYEDQVYHEGLWGIRGRISDYIWTCGDNSSFAMAYDAVYPALSADGELSGFLAEKGIDAPRNLIEQRMLQTMVDDIMRGYVAGNMGMHQRTLAELAIVLDNDDPDQGTTTEAMRSWLMSGGGRIEDLLWNGFWRDGLGGESSPSYASGWGIKFYDLADLLPRLGLDIWQNPKLRAMADVGPSMLLSGGFTPCIGDCGGVRGAKNVGLSADVHGTAFMRYGDPRYAAALQRIGARNRSLWDDGFDEDKAYAVAPDTELGGQTRVLGGYGLAVLESGADDQRRSVSLYYGDATGGHGHYDRLTIGFFALGYPMHCEMGYPTPFRTPKRFGWTSNTASHMAVLVDELRQRNRHAGTLHGLASAPGVQWVDAAAENVYPDMVSLYRRQTALVDIDDQRSYVVDIMRVRGGTQHDWCFHGPAFQEFSTEGIDFGAVQERGTLAGEDVPFGERPSPAPERHGVPVDVTSGQGLRTGENYGELSTDAWAVFGKCILTKSDDAQTRWTIPRLPPGRVNILLRIYDYQTGENHFDLSLGNATQSVRFTPQALGYRWVNLILEPEEAADTLLLATTHTGQKYLQISDIVLTGDLAARVPRIASDESNGFEFLRNVRQAGPTQDWSATWRNPADGVCLTTHVPKTSAETVFTAHAEPELQPGNPDFIHVMVGRNNYADGLGNGQFVSVSEAHRGDPRILRVSTLSGQKGSADAVGVAVVRDGATDYIHSSLEGGTASVWRTDHGPLRVSGTFAVVTVDAEGPRRAVLLQGTSVQLGSLTLTCDPPSPKKIVAVDLEASSVTIDGTLDDPTALTNTAVIFANGSHRAAYMVDEVTVAEGHTRLHLGHVPLRVAMGAVNAVGSAGQAVTSDRPLAGYGRIEDGRHQGRWLANEQGQCLGRIRGVSNQTITLEPGAPALTDASFPDADGDGRRLYWISEAGPGDDVIFSQAVAFERQ